MSTPISNNYDAMVDGAGRASRELSGPAPEIAPAFAVDPRLAAAVDDAGEQNRKGRDNVRDGADDTDRYTNKMKDLQDEGGEKVRAMGGRDTAMPAMPTVPQSAEAPPAPPAAVTMAPMTPMSAPMPPPAAVPSPLGLGGIDPSLLLALVQATQQQRAAAATAGLTPTMSADTTPVSHTVGGSRSATAPQEAQPLKVSQVSLDKYPAGQLSRAQTAAVIDQALTINGVPNDPTLRARWQQLYQHMADGESARVPNAVNTTDSNATGPRQSDGAPANSSRGIWQCIPSTFAAYHMGGTSTSIYDPVASAAASINYVMHRYHVSPTGEGLSAFAAARGVGRGTYTGY